MTNLVASVFANAANENRAALIAYLPAGFPTQNDSFALIDALLKNGVDLIEIGFPYSDPLMDGPIIQAAVQQSLEQGIKAKDVFAAVQHVAQQGGTAVVMSYFNPIFRYGTERFLDELTKSGGAGVITPDLIPDEAHGWLESASKHNVSNIFLVAPSSTQERVALVSTAATGFIYAASLMGVTGVKSAQIQIVSDLVARIRAHSNLPIAVGLGVNTPEQVSEISKFADGVIVGSAFVKAVLQAPEINSAVAAVGTLAADLAGATRRIS